jgi:hypothetical protein
MHLWCVTEIHNDSLDTGDTLSETQVQRTKVIATI